MKTRIKSHRLKAFSLTELLVVLVIVGILVLLALPNLMPLISKAHSTEAKLQLEHVYTLQKTYFMEHSKYAANLDEISFEQEKLVDEGGTAKYVIELVEGGGNGFIARARATADFDGDGELNIWEINQEKQLTETVKD